MPTLILHGRRDRTVLLSVASEMHDRIPGSQLATFSGGHLFFVVRSQAVVTTIERFVGCDRSAQ